MCLECNDFAADTGLGNDLNDVRILPYYYKDGINEFPGFNITFRYTKWKGNNTYLKYITKINQSCRFEP